MASRHLIRACDDPALVKRSPGLSSPFILYSAKSPFLSLCCTQRSCVSRCLTLPSPWREHFPLDALGSVQMFSRTFAPRSLSSDNRPRPPAPPLTTPCNSASPLDNVITGCVLLQLLIKCRPAIMPLNTVCHS